MTTDMVMLSMPEARDLAQVMIDSGFFKDLQDLNQAVVKILCGQEMGIQPMASCRGIDIVKGSIQIRAHLMASMIKTSSKYDYVVRTSTDQECVIEYWQNNFDQRGFHRIGSYRFTMADAKLASLLGSEAWRKYPKIMLYNRCMSMGAKQYCPDIFTGPIYEQDEIGPSPTLEKYAGSSKVDDEAPMVGQLLDAQPVVDPVAVQQVGKQVAATVDAQAPTMEEAVSNLFGDRGEPTDTWVPDSPVVEGRENSPQMFDEKGMFSRPPWLDLPEDEVGEGEARLWSHLATSKQIGFLCSLLKDRGVRDGDKKALITVVLGEDITKDIISAQIDSLAILPALTKVWINHYVRVLREIHGVSQDEIKTHLRVEYQAENPGWLNKANQLKLIDWLKTQPVPEAATESHQLTELEQRWVAFIDDLSKKSGRECAEVEAWLVEHARDDGHDISEIYDAAESVLERFEEMGTLVLCKSMNVSQELDDDRPGSVPDEPEGDLPF